MRKDKVPEARRVFVGVEDPNTGEWLELKKETSIYCPDCEWFEELRVKMLQQHDHCYCPKCGLIILKPAWGKI